MLQELNNLKQEAEMLKREVDFMRLHRERLKAGREGTILAQLRDSLPSAESHKALDDASQRLAVQVLPAVPYRRQN